MINIKIKLFLLAATLFFFLVLRFQGAELVRSYSPKGIVSLEIAPSAKATAEVLNGFTADGLIAKTRQNILIDFFFILFYSMLFYTLAGSISVRMQGKAATAGVLLAFFSLIAGLFDVIENILMLLATYGWYNDLTAILTTFFASTKFLLLFIALLYIIPFGIVVIMKKKITPAIR
jgi:hypothetical protein